MSYLRELEIKDYKEICALQRVINAYAIFAWRGNYLYLRVKDIKDAANGRFKVA